MAAEVGASAGAQQQIALPPEGADLSSIQDEDLLRRMWQATEDFGRKREIRARMYKLRERRLKEFYTTGEVLKDLMQTTLDGGSGAADGSATTGGVSSTVVTTTKTYAASESGDSVGGGGLVVTKTTETIRGGGGSQESLVIRYRSGGNEDENLKNIEMDRRQLQGSTEYIYETGGKTTRSSRTQMSSNASSQSSMITKNANYGIHSQSLADQGFLTLKSKEIRDSESPTRDFIPSRQIQQTSTVSQGAPGGGYWYEESRTYHTGDDGTEGVQFGARAGQQGFSSSTEYGKDGSTVVTRHGGEALIATDHKEEVSKTSRKEESSSVQQFSSSSSYSYSSGGKSTQDWVEKHIADESFERKQPMAIESSRRTASEDRHDSQEKIIRDARESVERTSTVKEQHVSRTEKEVDSKVEERRSTVDESQYRQTERMEDRDDASRGPKHKVTQRSKTGELPLDVNLAKQQIITTTSTTTEVIDASVPSTATSTPAPESGPAPDGASWTIVSGKQNGMCSSTDEFVFRSGTSTTEKATSQDVTEKVITSETTTTRQEKTATDSKPTAPSQPTQSTEATTLPTAGKPTATDSPVSSPVVEVKSIMKQTTTTTTTSSTAGSQQPVTSNNTTYYTQAKRISTDVSPTHEAFARSLRSSPEKTTYNTRASSRTSIDTNTTILSSPTRSQKVSVTSPTGPGGLISDRPRDRTSPLKQSSPSASKEKRKLSSSLSRGMAPKRTATPGASPSTSPVRGKTPCSDDEGEPRKYFESTSEKRRSVIRREGSPLTDQPSRKSPAKETKPSSRKTPEKSPARDLPKEDTTDTTTKVQRKTSETITKEVSATSVGRRPSKGPKDEKLVTRKPSSDKIGSPIDSLPKDKSPSKDRRPSEDKKTPTSPQRPKDLDLKSRTSPGTKDTTPSSPLTDRTPKEPKDTGKTTESVPKSKDKEMDKPESEAPVDNEKVKPLPVVQPQQLDDNFDVVCEVYPDTSLVKVVTPSSLTQGKPGDEILAHDKLTTEDLLDVQVKENYSPLRPSAPDEKELMAFNEVPLEIPTDFGEKVSPLKKSPEDQQQPKRPGEDDKKPSIPQPDHISADRPTRRDSLPGRRSPTPDDRVPLSPSRRTPIRDSPAEETQKKESPIPLRDSASSPSPVRKSPAKDSPREDRAHSGSPSPVRNVPTSYSPSRKSPAKDIPDQVTPSTEITKPSSMSPSRKTPERDSPSTLTQKSPSTGKDSPTQSPSRRSPARSSPARDSPNYSPSRPSPTRGSPARDSPISRPTEDLPKSRKSPARDSPVRELQRRKSPSPLRDTGRDTSSPSRKSPVKDDLKKDTPKHYSPSPARDSPKTPSKERKPSTDVTRQSPSRKSPARDSPTTGVTSRPSPERESPCRRHNVDRPTPESSPARKPSLKDSPRKESPARKTPERDTSRKSPTRRSPSKDTTKKTPERELPMKSPVRQSPVKDLPEKKPVTRKSSEREIVPKKEPSTRRSHSSEIPAVKKISPTKTDDSPALKSPATETSTRKSPPKDTVVRKIPQYTSPSRKPVTSQDSPTSGRPASESSSVDKPWRQSPYKSPGRDAPEAEPQPKTPVKEYPSSGIPRTMSPARRPVDSFIPCPESPKQKEPKAPCTAVLYDKQPTNQRRSRSPEKAVPRKVSNEKGKKPAEKPVSRIPGRAPANGTPPSPRRQTPATYIPSYQSPLRRTSKDDSSPAPVSDFTTPQGKQPCGRPQSGTRLPDSVEQPRPVGSPAGRITSSTTTKTEIYGKPKKPKKKKPTTKTDSSEEDEEGSTTESDTEREIVEEKMIVTEKEVRRVNEMLMQDMESQLYSIPNGGISDRPISLALITTTTKTTTSGGEVQQKIDADGQITTTTIHQPTTTTMSMLRTTRDIEGHEEFVTRTVKNTTYPGRSDEDEDVEIMEIDDDNKPAIEFPRNTARGPGLKPSADGPKRGPSQLKTPKKEPKQQIPTSIGRRPTTNDTKPSTPVEKKKTPMSTSPPKTSSVRKAPLAKPGIPSPIPIVSHAPSKSAPKSPGKPEQISRLPAKNVPKREIRSATSTTGRTTTQQQKSTVSTVMTATTNRQQINRITSTPQKIGKQPMKGEPLVGCIAKKPTSKGRIPQKTGKPGPVKDTKKSGIPSKKAPYTEQPKDDLDSDEEEVDVETPIPSDVEIIDKYDSVDDVETTLREKLISESKHQVKVTDLLDEKHSSLHPSSAGVTPVGMTSAPEIRPISRESTPDAQGKRQPRYADRVSEPDDDELYYEERTTQKREQAERTVNITMPRLETVEQKYAEEEDLEEFERIDAECRRPRRPEQVTDLDEDEPKSRPGDEDDIEPANLSVSSKVSRFLAASVNAAAPRQPSQTPKFSEPKRTPRTSWEPENESLKEPKRDEVDQRTITTDDTASFAVKRARNIFETIARAPESSPAPMSPKLKTDVLGKASFFETKQAEELRSAQRVLRKSFTGSEESLGDDGLPKEKPRTVYTDSEEDYDDDIQQKVSPLKKPFQKEPSPGRPSKQVTNYDSPKDSTPSQVFKPQAEKPFTKEASPVRKYRDEPERSPVEEPDEYFDDEKPSSEVSDEEESPKKTSPIEGTPKSSITKRVETETDVTRRRNLFRDAGPTPSDDDMSPKVKKTSVGSTMGREAFLKRMSKFASTTTETTTKPLKTTTEPSKAKPTSKFSVGGSPLSKKPRGEEPTKDTVRDRESPSRKAPTDTGMRRVSTDETEGARRSPARDAPTSPSDTFTRRPSKGGDESPRRTPTRETTAQKVENTKNTVEETRFSTDTFTRRSSKEIRREETTTRDTISRPTDSPTKPKTEKTPVTDKFARRPSKDRVLDESPRRPSKDRVLDEFPRRPSKDRVLDESPRRPRDDYPRGTDTFTKKPKSEPRESPQRESPSRTSPGRDLEDQTKTTGTYTRKKSTDRLKESSPSPRSSPSRDTFTRRPVSEEIPRTSVQIEPEEKKPVGSDTFPRRRSQPKEDEEPEKTPSAMDALKPYLRTRNQEFPGDDEDKLKPSDKTPKKLSSSRFDTFTKRDSSTTIKDEVKRTLSPGGERTPKKLSGSRFETFTKRDSSTSVKATEGVEYRTKSVTSSVTSTTERKSVERETKEMTTKTEKVTSKKTLEQTESSPSRTDRRTPDRKTPDRTDRRTPDRVDRRTPDRSDRRTPDRRTPDRKDDSPAGYGEPLRKKPTKDVQDEPVRKASRPEEDEVEARTSTRRRPSKEGSPRPNATTSSSQRKPDEEIPDQSRRRSSGGKFGVVLRQTSSVGSRVEALMSKVEKKTTGSITSTVVLTPTRRRSSKGPDSGLDIEEICDLELLEQMLEKATDYDQRRRIRAQIRLVRRGETPGATPSTPRDSTPSRPTTLGQTKTPKPSATPTTPQKQKPSSKEPSPAREEDVEDARRPSLSSSSPVKTRRGSSQPRDSPDREKPTEGPRKPSRAEEVGGELTSPSVVAKLLPSTGTPSSPAPTRTSSAPKKNSLTSSGLPREACPTDSITSSYGVGPTDESGRPLFGLRALRRPQQQAPPADNGPSAPAPSPNTQSREASLEPRPQSPETSDVRDSSGRPLFGLRAIKIGSSTTTSSKTTKEVKSQSTERPRSPQRRRPEEESESEEDEEGREMPSTSTTETSVQLRDLVRRHEQNARGNAPSQPVQLQKPKAKLRDSFILSHDEDEEPEDSPSRPSGPEPPKGVSSPASKTFPSALPPAVAESGKITERSTNLKSIIQKHEKIADTETTNNKLNRRDSGLGAYTEEEDLVPARNNYHSRAQDYSTDEEDEEYDDEEFQDYNNGDRSETTTVKVTSDVVKRPGILKKPKDNEAPESSSTTSTASTIRSQQTVTERSSGYVSSKKDVLRGVVDDSEDGAEESPDNKRRPAATTTKGSGGRRPLEADEDSPATPSSRATYSSYTTSSSSSSVSKSGQDASLERRRSSNTVPYTVEEVDGDSNDGIEVISSPSENRYEATTTTVTRRYASSSDSPKVVSTTTTVTRTSGGRPEDEAEDVQETTRVVKKKFPASTSPAPGAPATTTTGFSRVARGGSVRALSQKFQQAAAEAASGVPDSPSRAYPKAGLIFRTASFRQQGSPLPTPSPTSPLPQCHSASSPAIPFSPSHHLTNGHSGTKTVSGEVVERRTVTSVTRAVSASQKDDEHSEQQLRRRSVENDRVGSPTTRKGESTTTISSATSSRVRRVSDDEDEEFRAGGGDVTVQEQRSAVVVTNGSGGGRSFLGNQSKITGVQDVLSRMREADNEGPTEGDTAEDSEARALLNKFLGAQVILQGMEPLINAQSPSLVRQVEKQRVQKKQETVTAVYTSDTDLDGIWDERRLQQLLESCNDYDGRRKIRARIRTVMAEQKGEVHTIGVEDIDAAGDTVIYNHHRLAELNRKALTAAIVAEGRLEAEREESSGRSKALIPKQSSGDVAEAAETALTTMTTVTRTVQGELLPLIVDQLKNSLERRRGGVEGGGRGCRGGGGGGSSTSSEEGPFDSGTESGEDRKHQRKRRLQQQQLQQLQQQTNLHQAVPSMSSAGGEEGDVEDEGEEELVHVDGEFSSFMEGLKTSIEAAAARRMRLRAPGDGQEGQQPQRSEWGGKGAETTVKQGEENNKGEMSDGLLGEVHTALDKLQGTLQSAGNLDPAKSQALLSLISRLQTSLTQQQLQQNQKETPEEVAVQPPPPPVVEPQPKSTVVPDWKARAQRKRQGRAHTVGVSKEELADARRLLEKCQQEEKNDEDEDDEEEREEGVGKLMGTELRVAPAGSPSVLSSEGKGYALMKQSSAGDLGPPSWATNSLAARVFRPVHFEPQRSPTWASMFNKTAKPFQREALGKNPPPPPNAATPPPSSASKFPLRPPPLPPPPSQPELAPVGSGGAPATPPADNARGRSSGDSSPFKMPPPAKTETSQPLSNSPYVASPQLTSPSAAKGARAPSYVAQNNYGPPQPPTYHPPAPSQTYWPTSPYSSTVPSSSQASSVANGHSHRDSESSVTGSTSTKPETEEDDEEEEEEEEEEVGGRIISGGNITVLKLPQTTAKKVEIVGVEGEEDDNDDDDEDDDEDDEENESEVVTQKEVCANGVTSNEGAKTIVPHPAPASYTPEKRSVHHSLSLDSGSAKEGALLKAKGDGVGGGEMVTRASPLARSWTLDDPSALLFTPAECVQIAVHKAAIKKQISYEEEQRMKMRNRAASGGTDNSAPSGESPAIADEGTAESGIGKAQYPPAIVRDASGSRSGSYLSDSRTSEEVSRTTSGSSVSSISSKHSAGTHPNGAFDPGEVKESANPPPPCVPPRRESMPSYGQNVPVDNEMETEQKFNNVGGGGGVWSQGQKQNIPYSQNYVQATMQHFQPGANDQFARASDGGGRGHSNGPAKGSDERNSTTQQSHASRIQEKMEKKKKMKRANTIDIPKPINFYMNEDDYSSGDEEECDDEMADQHGMGDGSSGLGNHRAAYLALRGPIRVKIPSNQTQLAPSLQAKTESDRKFLAFLEQHSGNATNKAEPAYHSSARGGAHWSNRFSNIKTTFEGTGRGESSEFPGQTRGRGGGRGFGRGSVNGPASARNFWRAADDSVTRTRSNSHEPRLSKEGSTLLRRLFEERDAAANSNQPSWEKENAKRCSSEQISKLPWAGEPHLKGDAATKDSIVVGSLTVANKKQLFSAMNASPPVPEVKGPVPVGKFSHAPLSAFRPLPAKDHSSSSSSSSTPLSSPGAVRLASQKFSTSSAAPASSSAKPQSNVVGPRLGAKSPVHQKKTFVPMQECQSPKGGPPPWAKEDAHGRVMSSTARFETLSRDNSPPPPQLSYSSHSHVVHSHNMHPLAVQNIPQPLGVVPSNKGVAYPQNIAPPPSAMQGYESQTNAPIPPPRFNAPRTSITQKHPIEKPKPPPRPYSPPPPNLPPPPLTYLQPPPPPLTYSQLPPPPPLVPLLPVPHIEPPSPEPLLQSAAVTKVMTGPVQQQAVVQKRKKGGDMEEEEEVGRESAVKSLSSALHRLSVSPCRPPKTSPPSQPNPIDVYPKDMPVDGGQVYSADTFLHPIHATLRTDEQRVISHSEPQHMQFVGYPQPGPVTQQLGKDSLCEEQNQVNKILPQDQEEFYRKQLLAVQEAQRAQKRLEEAQNEYLSHSSLHQSSPTLGYQSPKTHKVQHASLTSDTRELNDESVVTMRLQIPVKETEWNAPHRETMSVSPYQKGVGAIRSSSYHDVRRAMASVPPPPEERRLTPKRDLDDRSPTSVLQKSESWHLLAQMGRSSPSSKRPQSLALDQGKRRVPTALPKMSFPKQFEARLSPETVETKQKTVEAYLKGQGTGTPPPARRKLKVQEPQPPLLLDDNLENVDEAFESLFTAATTAQDKRVSGDKSEMISKTSKTTQKVQSTSQSQQHLLRPPAPPRDSSASPQFQRKQKAWEESSMVKTKLAHNLSGSHSEATTMSSSLDSSVTKTEVQTKSSNYSATVTGKSRVSKAPASKAMSPFAKFKQLDEQNSSSAPNSPKSPGGTGPLFKFTDPQLSRSASGVKDKLLYWCQMKTKEYKNIQIENFSTSWSNGLAFCALIHHFCPEAFDYDTLRPEERRKNFELAFQVADDKAGIAPLLDVEDMVMMRKPDWKCVFTYVQSIYRRFKDED